MRNEAGIQKKKSLQKRWVLVEGKQKNINKKIKQKTKTEEL